MTKEKNTDLIQELENTLNAVKIDNFAHLNFDNIYAAIPEYVASSSCGLDIIYTLLHTMNDSISEHSSYYMSSNHTVSNKVISIYTRLIMEIPDISKNDIAKWRTLLAETINVMSIFGYLDVNNVLDRINNSPYSSGYEIFMDMLSMNELLKNKYLLYAPEETREYVYNRCIRSQLTNNSLWIEQDIINGSPEDVGQKCMMLCNLYNSFTVPSTDMSALFLSLSKNMQNMKTCFDNYIDITSVYDPLSTMFQSSYNIFMKTRDSILGHDKKHLMEMAECLGVTGDYNYWLNALSSCTKTESAAIIPIEY